MSDAPATPGWYEYPAGKGTLRWWDGTQWLSQPGAVEQQPLPAGTRSTTWAIWVMAFLPVVGIVNVLLQNPAGQMRASLERSLRQAQDPTAIPDPSAQLALLFTPGILLSYLIALIFLAVNVLLAVRDHHTLRGRGVVRPFPWGWAFLQPVYIIGRSVVIWRRMRGSLAPLWVYIGISVGVYVLIAVVIGLATQAALAGLT